MAETTGKEGGMLACVLAGEGRGRAGASARGKRAGACLSGMAAGKRE
jgi:hypothetical protein